MENLVDLYDVKQKMYVATDCIIFGFHSGELKLLLFKRKLEPLEGEWSLIGSFVRLDEDIDEAAKRALKEVTGLDNVFLEQLKSYGAIDRDPGYRCISIAQYALIRINDYDEQLVEDFGARWFKMNEIPELILDHNAMVRDALSQLQLNARRKPIGFELLPDKFTIPQLQSLYESIYEQELDSRNFRKKLLSLDVLKKLNEKDKTTSKRGAFLYKFDRKNYQKLLKSGYNFELVRY